MNEHSLIYMTKLYDEAMDLNTKIQEELENLKNTNEEHRVLNGKLREELEFEKATNKELLSTGAELENKLYEEQDKNKRLNNSIKKLEEFIEKEIELYTVELTEKNKNKLGYTAPIRAVYKEIYNVLQELKGSEKE